MNKAIREEAKKFITQAYFIDNIDEPDIVEKLQLSKKLVKEIIKEIKDEKDSAGK